VNSKVKPSFDYFLSPCIQNVGFGSANCLKLEILNNNPYYASAVVRMSTLAEADVSPNLVQVFTVTEGLAPEEIEKYVTYPVETAMNGLPGRIRRTIGMTVSSVV